MGYVLNVKMDDQDKLIELMVELRHRTDLGMSSFELIPDSLPEVTASEWYRQGWEAGRKSSTPAPMDPTLQPQEYMRVFAAKPAAPTRVDLAGRMPGGEDATAHEWDTGHAWYGTEAQCWRCIGASK